MLLEDFHNNKDTFFFFVFNNFKMKPNSPFLKPNPRWNSYLCSSGPEIPLRLKEVAETYCLRKENAPDLTSGLAIANRTPFSSISLTTVWSSCPYSKICVFWEKEGSREDDNCVTMTHWIRWNYQILRISHRIYF